MLLPDFLLSARRPLAVGFLWSHRGNWRSVPVPQSDPAAWSRTAVRLSQEPKTLALHHNLRHKHTHRHINADHWQSVGTSGIHRHWLPRSLRQSFHASARFRHQSAFWIFCLLWPQTARTATATTGSHSSRWGRGWRYRMNDSSFQTQPCCGHNTRGRGGSFRSGHTEKRSYVWTPHRELEWTVLL